MNQALRRFAVALLMSLVCAFAAQAQDSRTSIVQGVARDWLAAADRLDGTATWNAAGARFKQAIDVAAWTAALRATRDPLGPVVQRTSLTTTFQNEFPGVPKGAYALVQFRTAFAKNAEGRETVTLEQEGDGTWRVIGYSSAEGGRSWPKPSRYSWWRSSSWSCSSSPGLGKLYI